MVKLYLPELPTSPMFKNGIMTVEWQEFFRNLYDRSGGIDGADNEDTVNAIVSGLYSTPVNYGKRIDEIEKKIASLPSPKSYDSKLKDLESLIVSEAYKPSREAEMEIYTSLGEFKIQKDLTFSNSTGTLTLFTVTGDVWVNIIPVITTDVTSAAGANIRMGIVGNTDAMIVDSLATGLDARGIWVDQTPDNEIESTERVRGYFITDGNNIILTLDAQVDAGAITFYCFWSPLDTAGAGNVVVA